MDSTSSRELVNKEEKKQEPVFNSQHLSVFDNHPKDMQRHTLSLLVGDRIKRSKPVTISVSSSLEGSFFLEHRASLLVSAATKAVRNLALRIKVNETLAFMRANPNILQSLPFPIEIRDRHNRKIRRNCIIGALFALDEFDVIEAKHEANPSSLIPTIFSWFNKTTDTRSTHIKRQLQRQLEEESDPRHELATKNRRASSLKEIEELIKQVITCTDILNDFSDKPFKDLLDLKFIQDFITTAFSPDENDNGEEGIVWDFWQLNLDYIDLLATYVNNDKIENKSRPHLGGWWSRKTDVVDTAVWLAFLRCSQFCHLEVSAKGIGNVSVANPPVRFDCSETLPDMLVGVGATHFFGVYGDKLVAWDWAWEGRAGDRVGATAWTFETFVRQKHQHYRAYAGTTPRPEHLSDDVEIRSSPVTRTASS